ncbi:hypothetical protein Avbf_06168 [Armadillidium vulgare]|nr:hypothetical protein Avbf_06168 [Armadillidium vulgare]
MTNGTNQFCEKDIFWWILTFDIALDKAASPPSISELLDESMNAFDADMSRRDIFWRTLILDIALDKATSSPSTSELLYETVNVFDIYVLKF